MDTPRNLFPLRRGGWAWPRIKDKAWETHTHTHSTHTEAAEVALPVEPSRSKGQPRPAWRVCHAPGQAGQPRQRRWLCLPLLQNSAPQRGGSTAHSVPRIPGCVLGAAPEEDRAASGLPAGSRPGQEARCPAPRSLWEKSSAAISFDSLQLHTCTWTLIVAAQEAWGLGASVPATF